MSIRSRFFLLTGVATFAFSAVIAVVFWGIHSLVAIQSELNTVATISWNAEHIKGGALSTILLDPTSHDTIDVFHQAERDIAGSQPVISSLLENAEDRDAFNDIMQMWSRYDKDSWDIIHLAAHDVKTANIQLNTVYANDFKPFQAKMISFVTAQLALRDKKYAQMQIVSSQIVWNVVIPAVIALLLIVTMIILLARRIISRLHALEDVSSAIALGDISRDVSQLSQSRDELGHMAKKFQEVILYFKNVASVAEAMSEADLRNDLEPKSASDVLGISLSKMISTLRTIVRGVREETENVASRATEIGLASNQLAHTASAQAAAAEEVSVTVASMAENLKGVQQSMLDLNTQVKRVEDESAHLGQAVVSSGKSAEQLMESMVSVTHGLNQATTTSHDAVHAANEGETLVRTVLITSIEGMVHTMGSVRESIVALDNRSGEITQIAEIIGEIADQTNLLALNAAIEAARAGDAGRGFAVVADEVRKLAERCSAQARQISTLVSSIRKDTVAAVKATEVGSQDAAASAKNARSAAKTLLDIAQGAERVSSQLEQISSAAEAQARSTEQIAHDSETMTGVQLALRDAVSVMVQATARVSMLLSAQSNSAEEIALAVRDLARSVTEAADATNGISGSTNALNLQAQELRSSVEAFTLSS